MRHRGIVVDDVQRFQPPDYPGIQLPFQLAKMGVEPPVERDEDGSNRRFDVRQGIRKRVCIERKRLFAEDRLPCPHGQQYIFEVGACRTRDQYSLDVGIG